MVSAMDLWFQAYAHISLASFALIAFVVGGASFFRGLTGFGYAILAVPFVGLVATPQVAVIMAILMQLLMGPIGIRKTLSIVDVPLITRISAWAWVTTPLGLWLLDIVSADIARLLITGIAIVSFFAFMMKRAPTLDNSISRIALVGSTSGLLNGFAAMPGPPVVLHFVREQVPPAISRASMMAIFFATSIAGTGVALWLGMIDRQAIILTALTCPLMIGGNHLGSKFFGRVSEPVWRIFVIALLVVAAGVALIRLI